MGPQAPQYPRQGAWEHTCLLYVAEATNAIIQYQCG